MRAWLIIPFVAFWIGVHLLESAWASLLIYHALLLIPLVMHRKLWSFRSLIQGFNIRWLAVHSIACISGFFALTFLAAKTGFTASQLTSSAALSGAGIGFGLYFVLVNPMFEEIFWRDLASRPGKGLKIEDLAFGAFHSVILAPFLSLPYIVGFVFALILIGWAWRQIRLKEKGLAVPWLGHTLGDSMFVAIVWYLTSV